MALVVIVALLAWATVFGTIAGIMWRNRGGNAGDGFAIGAIFGIFGVAFCAFATPRPLNASTTAAVFGRPYSTLFPAGVTDASVYRDGLRLRSVWWSSLSYC